MSIHTARTAARLLAGTTARLAARLAAAATLLACASAASASGLALDDAGRRDGYLVLNTFAYHFEMSDERRDFTPGIGLEYSPSNRLGVHAGTLSDSFGYQAKYAGVQYATPRFLANRVRLMLGATALHKQYKRNSAPETKIVPLPALEISFSDRAVLNISGSPDVDFGDVKNNKVVWFQLEIGPL